MIKVPGDPQGIQEMSIDPFLGLTSDLRFVRDAVAAGFCPYCRSLLDTSLKAFPRFAIGCPSPTCAFILQPREMLPRTH